LAISEKGNAADAFCKIVAVLMSSQNGGILQTIQNSLFFKLRNFMGRDFTAALDEIAECMILLL
jgi:hypothetical protein